MPDGSSNKNRNRAAARRAVPLAPSRSRLISVGRVGAIAAVALLFATACSTTRLSIKPCALEAHTPRFSELSDAADVTPVQTEHGTALIAVRRAHRGPATFELACIKFEKPVDSLQPEQLARLLDAIKLRPAGSEFSNPEPVRLGNRDGQEFRVTLPAQYLGRVRLFSFSDRIVLATAAKQRKGQVPVMGAEAGDELSTGWIEHFLESVRFVEPR